MTIDRRDFLKGGIVAAAGATPAHNHDRRYALRTTPDIDTHQIISTDHTDATGTPTAGQVLTWDATLSKWKPSTAGGSLTPGANQQVLGTVAGALTWVYVAPSVNSGDLTLMKDPGGGTNWGLVKPFDTTNAYYTNVDPAVVLSSGASALTTAGGGTIVWYGQVPCKTPIVITDGVCLSTLGGYTKPGDPYTARLYATTGFTGNWLCKLTGSSGTLHGGQYDVNSLNALTAGTGIDQQYGCVIVTGNRAHLQGIGTYGIRSNSASDVNAISCCFSYPGAGSSIGGDCTMIDCDIRSPDNVGNAFLAYSGDLGVTACHFHGSGTGTGLFVASFLGHHTHVTGSHFEAGSTGSPQANVLANSTKLLFTGCKFGQVNDNPEMRIPGSSRVSISGCSFFDGGGLTSDNVTDMVQLVAATSRLTMASCQVHLGNSSFGWKNCFNNGSTQFVIAACDLNGAAAGAAWNVVPTAKAANTFNGVAV